MSVLRSHNNKTRGGLGRVCATGMYRSIEHVKFPKFQTRIFVEWKAPPLFPVGPVWILVEWIARIISELWKKKYISNLHVVDMPLNEPRICFFLTMQFYHTCRIRDETKKILGPKSNPPNFQALISPSPEIFPWRIKWYGTPKNEK